MSERTRPRGRAVARVRTTAAAVLGVLAVVGVLASVVAVWAHEVILDPHAVGRAVDQALDDPEVTDALASYLTDQVFLVVPVEARVRDAVPASLDGVVPILVGGLRGVVQEGLARRLADDDLRRVVVTAAETGHRAMLRVLDGGRLVDGVTVGDDTVTVNLLPLVGAGLRVLADAGLVGDLDVPELTAAGDPEVQADLLAQAIGRPLPDGFGQLVVYRGDAVSDATEVVGRARQALVLFRRGVAAILVVTVLSAVGSLVAARRRLGATIALLAGAAIAMGAGRALVRAVVEQLPSLAAQPGARAAVRGIVTSLADGLVTSVTIALLTCAVLGAGAALVDRRRTDLLPWLSRHRRAGAVALGALAAVVLEVGGLSPATVSAALVLAIAAVTVLATTPGRRPAGGGGSEEAAGR